ncbi:hypothetical protein CFter6_2626 [Collimonas fungivorans]|uniref:Uncharacterized protein n=1 Tax=Collimonas fungivorans TaxID=158899 RepID=A0A127PCG7_9BURK|nr:hypothetical protein CFter6_2626 [Collimonas fungivorans]
MTRMMHFTFKFKYVKLVQPLNQCKWPFIKNINTAMFWSGYVFEWEG